MTPRGHLRKSGQYSSNDIIYYTSLRAYLDTGVALAFSPFRVLIAPRSTGVDEPKVQPQGRPQCVTSEISGGIPIASSTPCFETAPANHDSAAQADSREVYAYHI